jgi:cytochrome c556
MFRVRILLAAVVAASALAVLAGPAQASVRVANSSSVCKPITGISEKLKDASTDTSKFNANTFKKFASALKASGKNAPAKVKKAANSLASFYSALGSGDTSALSKNSANLSAAITTYFTYIGTHCNT